jgi:hypothetical protein
MIEKGLEKFKNITVVSMRGSKTSRVEACLDDRFTFENNDNQYSVFMLSEA